MTVYNPYDRQPVATVDTTDWTGADHALTEATRAFSKRENWLTVPERIDILQNTQDLMLERAETLAKLIATEGGKPLTDARIETTRAIEGVGLAVMALKSLKGEVIPMGSNAASLDHFAYTRHEPCGVVLAYSAFNHPLNLIVHQAIPAVAAGCPFIVKPAEATPLSCITLVGILREAGLPNPWGQV
ncbi:MAG: aldehyde dehydrogenase family protein, partial [Gammaproteobacteria bacterium]